MKLFKVIYLWNIAFILGFLVMLNKITFDIYPDKTVYPNYIHMTLYLDRNFDDMEIDMIMKAAWEWSEATNHIVEYDIIQLPAERINIKNALFFVKKSPDDPKILLMDFTGKNKTLGVYDKQNLPSISIVADRLTSDNYKEVVLHELGHSLGLEHLDGIENIDSLMFPYTSIELEDGTIIPTGSDHITKKDLIEFCKLYHCDINDLFHQ